METLKVIEIQRPGDNQFVEASIVRLSIAEARKLIEDTWWNLPNVPDDKLKAEGDRHWRWPELIELYGRGWQKECVALNSKEGYIEGVVAYNLSARSKLEPDKGCAYIERISTAPRNRKRLVPQPLYKGVGSALMYWVLKQSYNEGLDGRIALESLPTPDTVKFYEAKGFVRTDLSQSSERLMDYELPAEKAKAWLRLEGDLPNEKP